MASTPTSRVTKLSRTYWCHLGQEPNAAQKVTSSIGINVRVCTAMNST